MSETNYLWQGGRRIEIEPDPVEVTIHAQDEQVAREAARSVGVEAMNVRRAGPGLMRAEFADRDAAMDLLRNDDQVVHHVYRAAGHARAEFLVSESFFLKFKAGTPDSFVAEYINEQHLAVESDLGDKLFLVRVTAETGKNPIRAANAAALRQEVEYAEPNLVRQVQRMAFIPADPLFNQQWHLHAPANAASLVAGAGVFAPDAWDVTLGSRDIVIAVADDGFDLTHPDFEGVGKIAGRLNAIPSGTTSLVWNEEVSPQPGDYHGTPCAGVALASNNGQGTVGVAPACAFLAVRFRLNMTDAQYVLMFERISGLADVVSCSWGYPPSDSPMSTALANKLTQLAATGGRRGKGLVICVAAGNNNAPVRDLANTSEYRYRTDSGLSTYSGPIDRWISAHPGVMTISASTSEKRRSAYSSWGKEICVCAPSNNFHDLGESLVPGLGIFTIDNEGRGRGTDFTPNSRFTPDFGGTSSATPTVAGVCGLVLSANPELTARQVRDVVQNTADQDLRIESDTPVNVVGKFVDGFSPWFGRGKVNAARAVAEAVRRRAPEQTIVVRSDTVVAIRDRAPIASELQIVQNGVVSDLRVTIDVRHSFIGDLRVSLVAPDGTAVVLQDRIGSSTHDIAKTYTRAEVPALAGFQGKSVTGTWTLRIVDLAQFDEGSLQSWQLNLKALAGGN